MCFGKRKRGKWKREKDSFKENYFFFSINDKVNAKLYSEITPEMFKELKQCERRPNIDILEEKFRKHKTTLLAEIYFQGEK